MSQALHFGPDPICMCRQSSARVSRWGVLMRSVRKVALTIQGWIERSRERQALQQLDDRLLRDIGVSRAAAMKEAAKPLWMQ